MVVGPRPCPFRRPRLKVLLAAVIFLVYASNVATFTEAWGEGLGVLRGCWRGLALVWHFMFILDQAYTFIEYFAGRAMISTCMRYAGHPTATLDIALGGTAMDLTTAPGMAHLVESSLETFFFVRL